jgi:alpha-N-arabinofuranosidase
MMRYPGGCLATTTTGAKPSARSKRGANGLSASTKYIELCRALGAEPLFTVSDYVLPLEEMPAPRRRARGISQQSGDPGASLGHEAQGVGDPEPYGVKWFELGNEKRPTGNHNAFPRRLLLPFRIRGLRRQMRCRHAQGRSKHKRSAW